MPGIAGIIRKSRYDRIDDDLDAMVRSLQHEERSSSGTYVDEPLGLWAGWVSHKSSYADCMPIVSPTREIVIIFHGEHYPDRRESQRLKEAGVAAGPNSARELLALYSEDEEGFYRHLNGWFSGLVVDRRRNRLTLFNDRYGMGRIYFHETDDEFIFSSEAKSLLHVRPKLRAISQQALAELLRYNCVLGNRTLFAGIQLLPHASAWSFSHGPKPNRERYFDFREWEQQPELDADAFYSQWAHTVSDVVPRYADGDRPVAVSVTAGLDSRLILAALGERSRRLAAYTFGGTWGELFDISTGRKAANVYGQQFEAIRITDRFLKQFGDYATRVIRISDGTHDVFGAHDVFFNERAREIAPIRLTGKFGSEVVRIRRLIGTADYDAPFLTSDLHSMVSALPDFQASSPDANHLTRVVTEEIAWHEYGRVMVEQTFLTLRTPYMDNDLVKVMYQAPRGSRAAGDLQETYVKQFAPELATFMTNLGRFASSNKTVTKLAYYPFWALFKVEYIYLLATPHWMTRLDRSLAGLHLERILGGRQKWEGYRIWIKTHFADFVRDTLLNPQAEYTRHFDYATVSQMVNRHIAGTHNYLDEINRALSVQLVYSTLLKA
jgi:asparagine synthase (glutamine-hydrolysing)